MAPRPAGSKRGLENRSFSAASFSPLRCLAVAPGQLSEARPHSTGARAVCGYRWPNPQMTVLRLLALLFALSLPLGAQLALSEFLASNSNSIPDEDGDNEDWIEIQNTTAG